jgi:hypothetical protein
MDFLAGKYVKCTYNISPRSISNFRYRKKHRAEFNTTQSMEQGGD